MKLRNVVTAVLFALAVGSAMASDFFAPKSAWVRKAHVSQLTQHCEIKGTCEGNDVDCVISFTLNDESYNNIPAFDGSTQSSSTCGTRLQMSTN